MGFSHLGKTSFPGGIPPLGFLLLRSLTSVESGSPDVYGLNLLPISLRPHKLDSRYVCLRIQLWQFVSAASSDHMLHFLPLLRGMLEHLMEHDKVMGAIHLPPGLSLKEQFNVHQSFYFSDQQALPNCPSFGSKGLMPFASGFLH